MTSDLDAIALVWQMMAAANLGGAGENVRHNLWGEKVKKVCVTKSHAKASFIRDMNHFNTSACLDHI